MNLLHTIGAFVAALGVLIVVHEYGHYLVARLCGVRVLRFSVGFGRAIATWRLGADQTEWVVAAVPFGGYVKMLDEREGPVAPHEAPRAFNKQSVWKRFAIVVAGPAFNFLFAILLYAGLFMYGVPEPRALLAEPAAGTLAHASGFREGDIVSSIDGEPVQTWSELRWRVLQGALERRVLDIEVVNSREHISLHRLDLTSIEAADVEADVMGRIGMGLLQPKLEALLGEIRPGSPAQAAGLASGDRILRVDGKAIASWQEFVLVIQNSPGKRLRLTVERAGASFAVEIVPELVEANGRRLGRIGAGAQGIDRLFQRVSYGPLASLAKGAQKTYDISLFSLKMLARMLVGQVSWKHLSGPITIADYAGQSAQLGWTYYITFLALISVSLGVLNLLPIPLLDGGHLMYYAIEIIKGRPVSERAMELGQRVGIALLLVMMAFAFYNDLNRLLTG